MASDDVPLLSRQNAGYDAVESRRQMVAKFAILSVLTLERLSYYALFTSFYLFLNEGPWGKPNGWDSLDAFNAVFVLAGISYISALIGGYISDACLGRFKAMVFGFLLYISGYVLLTLMAVDKLPRWLCSLKVTEELSEAEDVVAPPCKTVVYMSVSILGLGVGIVKSNIAPFGAEQLRTANPEKVRSFFNWFYWCINIGSLVSISVIAFIEQDSPGICTNGFFCGYLIATVCLTLALLIFVSVYPWYYISRPEGSLLGNIAQIIWEAAKAQYRHWKFSRRNPNLSPLHIEPAFLDRAKIRYGGSFHEGAVEDVRALGKLLAVFIVLIPYWLVYFQMETSFQAQGLHMRFAGVGHNGTAEFSQHWNDEPTWHFSIPAAWLTLFNQAFLVIAIPILTTCLYPRLDRAGLRLSLFFRMGVGMLFSMLAVMVAGGLESYRTYLWRNDNSTHIEQIINNVTYNAVDISIFWQIPQYVLVGGAEAFASIAGLEFAYSSSPITFQSLIMGLFYTLEGCGSLLGSAVLQLVSPFWFSSTADFGNINENHLDFYLYFLGVLQLVTLVIYAGTIYIQRFSLNLVMLPPQRAQPRRWRRAHNQQGQPEGPTAAINEEPVTFQGDDESGGDLTDDTSSDDDLQARPSSLMGSLGLRL